MSLPDKFLTVDPGEDTGYAVWTPDGLIDGGTEKMWTFSDALWDEVMRQHLAVRGLEDDELQDDVARNLRDIKLVVVENWALYPWVLQTGAMDWDECRTARLIGSIFAACRFAGWDYEQQPAKIKERAVAAGAENFYVHPLRENRHQNDAIQHGIFRLAVEHKEAWTDLSQTSWTEEA